MLNALAEVYCCSNVVRKVYWGAKPQSINALIRRGLVKKIAREGNPYIVTDEGVVVFKANKEALQKKNAASQDSRG